MGEVTAPASTFPSDVRLLTSPASLYVPSSRHHSLFLLYDSCSSHLHLMVLLCEYVLAVHTGWEHLTSAMCITSLLSGNIDLNTNLS